MSNYEERRFRDSEAMEINIEGERERLKKGVNI